MSKAREFDENAAKELASKCTEWHGCASGDCPHDTYRECFDAVHIEGQRDQFEKSKADLDALREKYDKYEQAIFKYSHENVSGEYAGYHVAEALVMEHKSLKYDLQAKDQRIEELEELLSDWKKTNDKAFASLVDLKKQTEDAKVYILKGIEAKDAEIQRLREALKFAEKRFAHIENWHRDFVTPDNFKDCQDIGSTPEAYLRDGKNECREALKGGG